MAVTNVNKVGTTFFTDINDISWKFQFSMCQFWLWQQSPLSKDSFVTVIGDIFKMSPMAVTKEPSLGLYHRRQPPYTYLLLYFADWLLTKWRRDLLLVTKKCMPFMRCDKFLVAKNWVSITIFFAEGEEEPFQCIDLFWIALRQPI